MAELADAQDLKSCGTYTPVSVRFRSPAYLKNFVGIAQLDRAFGYGPKGWGFESSCPRLILLESVNIALSPNGKALDSDSSILGVRVPQAQLTLAYMRGLFLC